MLLATYAGSLCPDLAPQVPATGSGRWRLEHAGRTMLLLDLSEAGHVEAERSFSDELPCAELRRQVGLVLESWGLSLHPTEPPLPDLPPVPPGSPVLLVTVEPPPRRSRKVAVGGWVGVSATAAGAAPAAVLEVASEPPAGLFIRGSVLAEANREIAIGPGACSWTRLGLAAGPGWRWQLGRWSIGLGLDAWLSLVTASGVDVPGAQTTASANLGLGLAADGALRFGNWSPFLELRPLAWLPERAALQGTTSSADIPSLELLGGAGIRWAG